MKSRINQQRRLQEVARVAIGCFACALAFGAYSRPLGKLPPPMSVGQHTVTLAGVNKRDYMWREKTYTSACGRLTPFPGAMARHVGWGQVEASGENCMAFVMQMAVEFSTSWLDRVPDKRIDRVVLTYNETPGQLCPLILGYSTTCWQGGDMRPAPKPHGCVEVRVPSVDWRNGSVRGMVPHTGARPTITRLSANEWDVTEAFRWQHTPGGAPLGATRGYGFLLTGWPSSIEQLTAQDNTVCISKVDRVHLRVTYTVLPPGPPVVVN